MNRLKMGAVTLLLVVLAGSGIAMAETSIGVGYEAMFIQDFLQGASVRAWFDNKWGLEGNIMQASMDVDGGPDMDMYFLSGKVMYAPIIRENSQFYVGFEGGYGNVDDDDFYVGESDVTVFGPLFGAEYRFQGLPDLGFNWEVGYRFASLDADDGDVDLNGVSITLGVHYRLK